MKGLAPKNRVGFAFGSYGWSGQSVKQIEDILTACKFTIPLPGVKINYRPSEEDLDALKASIEAAFFKE